MVVGHRGRLLVFMKAGCVTDDCGMGGYIVGSKLVSGTGWISSWATEVELGLVNVGADAKWLLV